MAPSTHDNQATPKPKRPYKMTRKARRARRQNAQHATGPRTDEGRRRSRMNALKHGVFAETHVLANECPVAFQAHVDMFVHGLEARTELERHFAEHAALSSWRYRRAAGADAAILDRQVRAAMAGSPAEQRREVAALAARLVSDPVEVVSTLRGSVLGCEYLLGQWRAVAQTLRDAQDLFPSQRPRAICLTGKRPTDLFYDEDILTWTWYFLSNAVG